MVYVRLVFDKYYNGEKNFMTPDILKYLEIEMNDELLLIELSWGTGLFDHELFGVTCLVYNPVNHETQKIDLCKAFSTSKEAYNYINDLSFEDFKDARRYGEVKIC